MNETQGKRVCLAAYLAAVLLLLSGCVSQMEERGMVDLSQMEMSAEPDAPAADGVQAATLRCTLYFLSEDGGRLIPVTREVTVENGKSRAQAALEALLGGPQEGEKGVSWPDLGAVRGERLLEVSCGVAMVDLPARVRTLSQEMLYAVRMAIANTLTEFSEISYVNVLIGGREEGLDLGATLPVGTLTRVEDLDVRARYARLHEQRLSQSGVTLLTTLYFPAAEGELLVPEVRNIAYARVSPIEYLYTLLTEMGKGAGLLLCAQGVPAPMDFIEEMPEIVRTEDGYMAIELQFSAALMGAIDEAGLTRETYMAMLTDTLMGFVPGVEGLKVTVGGEVVSPLLTRRDFAGCIGAPTTLYVAEGSQLRRVQRVLPQNKADDARTRLETLMALENSALPKGLTQEDVLAVYAGAQTIAVNLSARFRDALAGMTPEQERTAVYAMVNTLTEGVQAERTAFFFEGEQVQTLAGGLELRGEFVRNPGMVVDEE
ncbi:MAG: GerMN domain-containing protein [Christensenellales bacterium]|nr:GerMN domain-containing protein [Christensenellales bacterium]